MAEAWDRVPATQREADSIATFIIFCEDSINEPVYFRSFQKLGKVKVNIVEGQLSTFKNVIKTLEHCEKEGLLENVDGHYRIKAGTTNQVWSVYDRDLETDVVTNIDPANDMEFSLSIQAAEHAGLKVAWSNDAVQRAQALETAFPITHRFHQRNPSTRIPHLVNSIRSFH